MNAVGLVKKKYADPNDLDSFKEEDYSPPIVRYHEVPNNQALDSTFVFMGTESPNNYSNNGYIEHL